MNSEFDDIKKQWRDAKKSTSDNPDGIRMVIDQARSKKRSTLYHQYGNIGVLTAVLITIALFFRYLFPFQELLSRTGVWMMLGGLAVRICVEIFSTIKSRQIDLTDDARRTAETTLGYYRFRKFVNGPVTVSLVAVYVVGFAALTPEFLKYISAWWMALYDSLFVLSGIVLIWQIRKGIRQEMQNIEDLASLHRELTKADS